jgi:uncharacterized protein (TIGR02001 family)
MKKILIAAVAASALFAGAGAASAEGALSYNIAVTSDYVWRGVSQNDEDPAIQAGLDYTNGMFYAGAWSSNVSPADIEVDLYAGVKPSYGDFAFDFGAIYYWYNDKDLDFGELKAAVSHPVGKGSIGAAAFINVDRDLEDYIEVNGSYPITDKLTVSGAFGDYGYNTWNLGAGYAIDKTFSVDVRYSDTDIKKPAETVKLSDERVALTLKAAF